MQLHHCRKSNYPFLGPPPPTRPLPQDTDEPLNIWINTLQAPIERDSVTRWILRSKQFNQCFLCMRWWLSRSFKSFALPYTNVNFLFAALKLLTNFENDYWKSPQNSLLCDWSMFSGADLSLAAVKMRKHFLVKDGFRYDITESQAASCKHFLCQNCCFWVFEAGNWKDCQTFKGSS
jgi:hypothetical protein